VLLWAVIAALVTAVLLLAVERETNEISRHYIDVIIAVTVVAACVCALACQYALLPRKDKRICYLNPDAEAKVHHLAYITDAEKATLMKPEDDGGHDALGESFPGMFGTQGVPCYPKRKATTAAHLHARNRVQRERDPWLAELSPRQQMEQRRRDQEQRVIDEAARARFRGALRVAQGVDGGGDFDLLVAEAARVRLQEERRVQRNTRLEELARMIRADVDPASSTGTTAPENIR
jgi:hypothetical protein